MASLILEKPTAFCRQGKKQVFPGRPLSLPRKKNKGAQSLANGVALNPIRPPVSVAAWPVERFACLALLVKSGAKGKGKLLFLTQTIFPPLTERSARVPLLTAGMNPPFSTPFFVSGGQVDQPLFPASFK